MSADHTSLLGTPQEQLGVLLGDTSVPAVYAAILAVRCPRCGSGAGTRCRTAGSGQITYPHTARIQDAVSAVSYFEQAMRRLEHRREDARRQKASDLHSELEIAGVLRAAGFGVDDAADWSGRMRRAVWLVKDINLGAQVVDRFLTECGIPEQRRPELTAQIIRAAGR